MEATRRRWFYRLSGNKSIQIDNVIQASFNAIQMHYAHSLWRPFVFQWSKLCKACMRCICICICVCICICISMKQTMQCMLCAGEHITGKWSWFLNCADALRWRWLYPGSQEIKAMIYQYVPSISMSKHCKNHHVIMSSWQLVNISQLLTLFVINFDNFLVMSRQADFPSWGANQQGKNMMWDNLCFT